MALRVPSWLAAAHSPRVMTSRNSTWKGVLCVAIPRLQGWQAVLALRPWICLCQGRQEAIRLPPSATSSPSGCPTGLEPSGGAPTLSHPPCTWAWTLGCFEPCWTQLMLWTLLSVQLPALLTEAQPAPQPMSAFITPGPRAAARPGCTALRGHRRSMVLCSPSSVLSPRGPGHSQGWGPPKRLGGDENPSRQEWVWGLVALPVRLDVLTRTVFTTDPDGHPREINACLPMGSVQSHCSP